MSKGVKERVRLEASVRLEDSVRLEVEGVI